MWPKFELRLIHRVGWEMSRGGLWCVSVCGGGGWAMGGGGGGKAPHLVPSQANYSKICSFSPELNLLLFVKTLTFAHHLSKVCIWA